MTTPDSVLINMRDSNNKRPGGRLFLRTDISVVRSIESEPWRMTFDFPIKTGVDKIQAGAGYLNGSAAFIAALMAIAKVQWAEYVEQHQTCVVAISHGVMLTRPGFRPVDPNTFVNKLAADMGRYKTSFEATAAGYIKSLYEAGWPAITIPSTPWNTWLNVEAAKSLVTRIKDRTIVEAPRQSE